MVTLLSFTPLVSFSCKQQHGSIWFSDRGSGAGRDDDLRLVRGGDRHTHFFNHSQDSYLHPGTQRGTEKYRHA